MLPFISNRELTDLFVAEALTWVQLEKHPFIVRAYLVEKFDNRRFVITEYIRGQESMGGSLTSWLGHPRLTIPVAAEMAMQIAQGMQHANRRIPGLVHRDLKPANVLVDDRGRAMVTDFGLVRAHAEAGTPAYMAPEQWSHQEWDARSDIYAYGCMLYEMFTGYRLFAATSIADWQAAHFEQLPVLPRALAPNLPETIERLILGCIAKNRTLRPTNWDDVVNECARLFFDLTGQPPVLNFDVYVLTADELIAASYSLSQLDKHADMLEICDRAPHTEKIPRSHLLL